MKHKIEFQKKVMLGDKEITYTSKIPDVSDEEREELMRDAARKLIKIFEEAEMEKAL